MLRHRQFTGMALKVRLNRARHHGVDKNPLFFPAFTGPAS